MEIASQQTLRERVEAACAAPPLSEISAEQRAELEREVEVADSFEDLRGKWQAAVLEAENPAGYRIGSSRSSRCCRMRAVAPQTRLPPTV
jgi:hypothetical protein